MKIFLSFLGGMLVASLWYICYLTDNTSEIMAFLESREAVQGKTIYLPSK